VRARSRESTSGWAVDVGPEVGSRLSGLIVKDVWPGARADVVFRQLPRAEVVLGGSPRRMYNSGKYFRFCCITQNFVLHDVHSMETAVMLRSVLFACMLF